MRVEKDVGQVYKAIERGREKQRIECGIQQAGAFLKKVTRGWLMNVTEGRCRTKVTTVTSEAGGSGHSNECLE